MTKRSIHIDQLQIRLQGVAPHVARSAVSELGQELLNEIAQSAQNNIAPAGRSRRGQIDKIDVGAVTLSGVAEPAALRQVIAQRVAASIFPKSK